MKQMLTNIFLVLEKKEKRRFINLLLLDVVVSVLDIGFIVLLLFIIHYYSSSETNKQLFSSYLFTASPILPILVFFLLFCIKNIFAFFVFRMQHRYIYAVATRISNNRLIHYLQSPYAAFAETDSAIHMRSISQQPLEFCNYVLKGVQQIVSQVMLICLAIVPIIIYNATLFPLLLLILLPPVALVGIIMKRKSKALRSSVKKTGELAWQHLKESLTGYVESNIYQKNHFFQERYFRFQSKQNHYLAEQQTMQNLPPRMIEVFAVFGLFILIGINVYRSGYTGLNIITIGAFVAAAYKIIPGIVKIINSAGQLRIYSFSIEGLASEKDTRINIPTKTAAIQSIQFNGVFFYYGQEIILNNFSINIQPGDFVGIAGISGNGKTTFVNLLLGFLQPAKGCIAINGQHLTTENNRAFWNSISYIKQQSFLIHDSILKNIVLDENGYDSNKLSLITKITGVDDLISKGEHGLHTIVAEEGKNFSGGQKQRIILARALYKEADTIILDEPFNELDEQAERNLLTYLKKLADSGKIIILITHNKESLSFCNKKIDMA